MGDATSSGGTQPSRDSSFGDDGKPQGLAFCGLRLKQNTRYLIDAESIGGASESSVLMTVFSSRFVTDAGFSVEADESTIAGGGEKGMLEGSLPSVEDTVVPRLGAVIGCHSPALLGEGDSFIST